MDAQDREKKIFRYMARYGQHPETEARNLPLSVSEIARMYGLAPECLRHVRSRRYALDCEPPSHLHDQV